MSISNQEIQEIRKIYKVPTNATESFFTATSQSGSVTAGYGNVIDRKGGQIDIVIKEFDGNEKDGDEDVYYEEYICFRF